MTVCIYHKDCADGFCAAWILRGVSPDARFVPMHYGDFFAPIEYEGEDVYILDFSFKRPVMEELKRVCKSVVCLDHHATAASELDGLEYCTFDMSRSGAQLTWDHFHPGVVAPLLVRYVQDRDLWRWKLPESREINAVIGSYSRTFENYHDLDLMINNDYDLVVHEGRTILRIQDSAVKAATRQDKVLRMRVGGFDVPGVNVTSLISETVGALAKDQPFAVGFFRSPTGWVCSLRSDSQGRDVSLIAKQYGGGGHARSSGFTIKDIESLIRG